ncbi:MAG: HAD-IA family hydrolase [Pseudomonadota bacterium]
MSARLVIFDVDGTLIDSQAHIMSGVTSAFGALGLAMPAREEIRQGIGLSLPQFFWRLVPDSTPQTREKLVEAYKDSFVSLRQSDGADALSPLFPGVADLLTDLTEAPDVTLGVATGKSRRGLRHVLALHGLEGTFASEQVADDHPSKPHPSMILQALAETDHAAEQAVMVGDTSYDIEMAQAAGVASIGVSWGYHSAEVLAAAGAGQIVETVRDLHAALGMAEQ